MSVSNAMDQAVADYVAIATSNVVTSNDKEEIRRKTEAIRAALAELRAKTDIAKEVLVPLLEMAQRRCTHEDAQRGYNGRDGSWMNTCPTCGASE